MNNIKRIFSCFSVLAVCLLANLGVDVKALPVTPDTPQIEENALQNENFILYNGSADAMSSSDTKIADHYSHVSHSSHSSHRSHYSSRF